MSPNRYRDRGCRAGLGFVPVALARSVPVALARSVPVALARSVPVALARPEWHHDHRRDRSGASKS
jgi:hypothetical protein